MSAESNALFLEIMINNMREKRKISNIDGK
jgi:hypothetical protein